MEQTLTAVEIGHFEKRLKDMLDALREQLDDVQRNTLEPSGDPQGQQEDENVEDTAFERDGEALATEDELAYQVREALDRIADGSYGICENCGRQIERERLEQLPFTNLCVPCAMQAASERGPAR
jgi:RNA polymerase-binding transcription factor